MDGKYAAEEQLKKLLRDPELMKALSEYREKAQQETQAGPEAEPGETKQ
jgi:hypothetical protein